MIGRISENSLFDTVNFKQKRYDDGYEFIEYSKPIKIRKKGFEEVNKENKLDKLKSDTLGLEKEKEVTEKVTQYSSIRRTKNLLMDYVRSNKKEWHSFVTLTFKENKTDLTSANRCFNSWCSSVRRKFKDFKYLAVPEFQKRGAVHYHVFTNLIPGSDLVPLQDGKKNMYDVKFWNYGFSSVFNLDCTDENFRADLYLTKYFTKDFERALMFGRRKVLASSNLKKPSIDYSYLDDEQIKNHIESCSVNAKEIKEKTVSCANDFCPLLKITNIVIQK